MEILKIAVSLIGGIGAGYIGAISSGEGLLSIPLLIFLGLSPSQAIATNRFSSFGLSLSTIPKYHKAGKINWPKAWALTPLAVLGGYIGAHILLSIDTQLLSYIVAGLLIALLPIVLLKKDVGLKAKQVSRVHELIGYLSFFLIMIYGGFFGGGSGPFLLYSMTSLFGMTYIEANATSFVPWLFLSATALVVFIQHGLVDYSLGISMGIGMAIGGLLGAGHALKKGDSWVRLFFIAVIVASAAKLIW